MSVLIGADPEFFVANKGKIVSGFGMVPGTKTDPHKVDNGAVQVDGMALEININPAPTSEAFRHNLHSVMQQLQSMLPENHRLAIQPVANFNKTYMKKQPFAAKLLGCEPDFNAYESCMNPPPKNHPTMRTAAGHVHVGWGEGMEFNTQLFEECVTVVKDLDLLLGVPSILLDVDANSQKRREMYGQAGAFRPKPYGVEYRVLSNFWLKEDKLIDWVFNTTELVMNNLLAGNTPFHHAAHSNTHTKEVINNSVEASARGLIRHVFSQDQKQILNEVYPCM